MPAEGQQSRLVAVEEDLEGAVVALADHRDKSFVSLQAKERRASGEHTVGTGGCEGGDLHIRRIDTNTLRPKKFRS